MSPFSAPFSWGTRKRRLLLPKRAAALWEGTQWGKGGTGKAEDAKLPDAGISLKHCPGKRAAEKGAAYSTRQQSSEDQSGGDRELMDDSKSRCRPFWMCH
jgi:hypothetical protein